MHRFSLKFKVAKKTRGMKTKVQYRSTNFLKCIWRLIFFERFFYPEANSQYSLERVFSHILLERDAVFSAMTEFIFTKKEYALIVNVAQRAGAHRLSGLLIKQVCLC